MKEEKKYTFTRYISPDHSERIEKTESKLTEPEKQFMLGNLINTWENSCEWARNEFRKQLRGKQYDEILEQIENIGVADQFRGEKIKLPSPLELNEEQKRMTAIFHHARGFNEAISEIKRLNQIK